MENPIGLAYFRERGFATTLSAVSAWLQPDQRDAFTQEALKRL
jgi:hypothetical protein